MTAAGPRPRLACAALALLLALLLPGLAPGEARAATTRYVLHVPAYPVENACNGTFVILHGDLVITQVTTPAPDGGTWVRSRTRSVDLRGVDENGMSYRAHDVELSFAHYASSSGAAAWTDVHTTLLLPEGDAPRMRLVTLVRETVAPDGTTSVALDRSYTLCAGRRGA